MKMTRARRTQRGVTLVEAMVAFFVMALGMLAAVATQMTLRLNNDVAKQRSEAVRLAQNDLDTARSFVRMAATQGLRSYADILPTLAPESLPFSGTNASYSFIREVPEELQFPYRAISAQVTWQDRQGQTHPVRLDTIVAGVDPALSGYLSLAPDGQPTQVAARTNRRLPPWVRDLNDGRSVLKPRASDTTAWIFDNRSGSIVARCVVQPASTTATLTAADLTDCTTLTVPGRLINGYVWFSLTSPPSADAPVGTAFELHPVFAFGSTSNTSAECYDNASATSSTNPIQYVCAVFPGQAGGPWSGYLTMASSALWRGDDALYTLCRYTADLDQSGSISNDEHPLDYVDVTQNLLYQNFLVVLRGETCPVGTGVNRTAQHDPRPA